MNLRVGDYSCDRDGCTYTTKDPLNFRRHQGSVRHNPQNKRPMGRAPSSKKPTTLKGTFEMMPSTNPERNHRLYIVGASGSGKSYFSAAYVRNHKLRYPDAKFFVVSNKAEDAPLDELNPVAITPEQAGEITSLASFKNSVVLFDDVDSFPPEEKKVVMRLYSHMVKDGRSDHIQVMLTSHTACNYHETRDALINSSHLVFFPQYNQGHHLLQFLKLYGDLTKAQIREVLKWDTRWCVLHREVPRFVLGEHNLRLL